MVCIIYNGNLRPLHCYVVEILIEEPTISWHPLMESDIILPSSQEGATCPFHEPVESNPFPPNAFSLISMFVLCSNQYSAL
jgi:hypothetical protein